MPMMRTPNITTTTIVQIGNGFPPPPLLVVDLPVVGAVVVGGVVPDAVLGLPLPSSVCWETSAVESAFPAEVRWTQG